MRVHTSRTHRQPVTTMLWKTSFDASSRVEIGAGAIDNLSNLANQIGAGEKVLVLCQEPLKATWGRRVEGSLDKGKLLVETMTLPDGDAAKSQEVLLSVWHKLEAMRCQRGDTIVACGGGALSDLAGFAASTYLRGINLILVPTSLLAQVDAALGGKTAINLSSGKNLVGTFYFPQAVVIDTDSLETLSQSDLQSGLGEIIKYALIEKTVAGQTQYKRGPRSLLSVLESAAAGGEAIDADILTGIIATCVKMKLAVVAADPHEAGLRRSLNLGHTLGHALEKGAGYLLPHGHAVAIGTVFACRLAERLSKLTAADVERVTKLVQALGLPHNIPVELANVDVLVQAMAYDKKMQADAIKFVLPTDELGLVDCNYKVNLDEMRSHLQ